MDRGFAFLPILAIVIIGIIAGSTGLSLLKEKPGSSLYGLQRTAETAPTNLLNYLSANYSAGLKEKRTAEVKDVLRSKGKDAALAFAQKEGVLDEKARLDIAQYVPLIDGTKENLITVMRLTTPENVSLGKESVLVKGAKTRIEGTDLVLEAGEEYGYGEGSAVRLAREGQAVTYGDGKNFVLLLGGDSPMGRALESGKTVTSVYSCDRDGCLRLYSPSLGTGYDWSFLEFANSSPKPSITAYLVKDKEYLGMARMVRLEGAGEVWPFERYKLGYEVIDSGVRIRVSPIEERVFYAKICGNADYRANGTACGAGNKKISVSLSNDGRPASAMYSVGIRVLRGSGIAFVSATGRNADLTGYVALFSQDGTRWDDRAYVADEIAFVDADNRLTGVFFDIYFFGARDYLELSLPEGEYGFAKPGAAEGYYYAVLDTDNPRASLEYGLLDRRLLGEWNIYLDLYGLPEAGKKLEDAEAFVDSIFRDFYSATGNIPRTRRIKASVSVNPFASPDEATAYYGGEEVTIRAFFTKRTVCHELAHGLQIENGDVDLGSPFREGFAEYLCIYLYPHEIKDRLEYPATFQECISTYEEQHDLGECIFKNVQRQGLFSDSFFRNLIEFPCEIKEAWADLKTSSGKDLWYYVLSTATRRGISGFPHTWERDYCALSPDAKAAEVREVRTGERFTLSEGEIVRLAETGAYLALGKAGEGAKAAGDFEAGVGGSIGFAGYAVLVRSIGEAQQNYTGLGGSPVGQASVELTIGGNSTFVYSSEGSREILPGIYAYLLGVSRDKNGRAVARLRLEQRVPGTEDTALAYIEARQGVLLVNIRASVAAGRALLANSGYAVTLERVDAAAGQAVLAVSKEASVNAVPVVLRCGTAPYRIVVGNSGSEALPAAEVGIYDALLKRIGGVKLPEIRPTMVAEAEVQGRLDIGRDMYLEYPEVPLIRFYC